MQTHRLNKERWKGVQRSLLVDLPARSLLVLETFSETLSALLVNGHSAHHVPCAHQFHSILRLALTWARVGENTTEKQWFPDKAHGSRAVTPSADLT